MLVRFVILVGLGVTYASAAWADETYCSAASQARPIPYSSEATENSVDFLEVLATGDEQLEAARQLYEERRAALGTDHPDTLTSATALVRVLLLEADDLTEAQSILVRTLAAQRRILGPDHVDTLRSASVLASLHEIEGRYPEAIAMRRQILGAAERSFGPDAPVTAHAAEMLGTLLRRYGSSAEALPLLRRGLASYETTGHQFSESALGLAAYVAPMLVQADRHEEAAGLFCRMLPYWERRFGLVDERTALTRSGLAGSLVAIGRLGDAEDLYRDLVMIQTFQNPGDIVLARREYATFLNGQRRIAEARDQLHMALLEAEDVFGPTDAISMSVRNEITSMEADVAGLSSERAIDKH